MSLHRLEKVTIHVNKYFAIFGIKSFLLTAKMKKYIEILNNIFEKYEKYEEYEKKKILLQISSRTIKFLIISKNIKTLKLLKIKINLESLINSSVIYNSVLNNNIIILNEILSIKGLNLISLINICIIKSAIFTNNINILDRILIIEGLNLEELITSYIIDIAIFRGNFAILNRILIIKTLNLEILIKHSSIVTAINSNNIYILNRIYEEIQQKLYLLNNPESFQWKEFIYNQYYKKLLYNLEEKNSLTILNKIIQIINVDFYSYNDENFIFLIEANYKNICNLILVNSLILFECSVNINKYKYVYIFRLLVRFSYINCELYSKVKKLLNKSNTKSKLCDDTNRHIASYVDN